MTLKCKTHHKPPADVWRRQRNKTQTNIAVSAATDSEVYLKDVLYLHLHVYLFIYIYICIYTCVCIYIYKYLIWSRQLNTQQPCWRFCEYHGVNYIYTLWNCTNVKSFLNKVNVTDREIPFQTIVLWCTSGCTQKTKKAGFRPPVFMHIFNFWMERKLENKILKFV